MFSLCGLPYVPFWGCPIFPLWAALFSDCVGMLGGFSDAVRWTENILSPLRICACTPLRLQVHWTEVKLRALDNVEICHNKIFSRLNKVSKQGK